MPNPPSDPRQAADSFFAPENEVLDVYTGDTLEEAMAGAVAALGPGLEVRRARKVRSGVRGLMGRPVYEVLAVAGRATTGGDPLRSAVDQLLERADAQEARGTGDELPAVGARPAPSRAAPAPPRTAPAPPRTAPALPRPARQIDQGARPALEGSRPLPTEGPHNTAPETARAPGWSRAGLARIGVPVAVLNALPRDAPSDDLGWLVSVTAAISACVGPPATSGPEHPVVVNGYGLPGVLGILEAGCRGATPGRISYADRSTNATALELALVLHASLTGR